MNWYKTSQQKVSLYDLYDDNDFYDDTEAMNSFLTEEMHEKEDFTVKLANVDELKKFKTYMNDMTVFEAFSNFATEEQKQLVYQMAKNFDHDRIILIANETVLDGNHQLMAAILSGNPQKYIDVYEE